MSGRRSDRHQLSGDERPFHADGSAVRGLAAPGEGERPGATSYWPGMSPDRAMSGSGSVASCGLFGGLGGSSASSPAMVGPSSGSGSPASSGLFGLLCGRVDSSCCAEGAMSGSGAIAFWACAPTEQTRVPAARNDANLLWMVIEFLLGCRSRRAPRTAHHPLVSAYL